MSAVATVAPSGVQPSQLSAPSLAGGSVQEPAAGAAGGEPTPEGQTKPPGEEPKVKPEWAKNIPDKFVRGTVEESLAELSKAHGELEKTLGQRPGAQPAKPKTAEELVITQDGEPGESIVGGIESVLKTAGLKAEDITAQWKKEGRLTPDQYQAFGRAKFSKDMINDYLTGQSAVAELESMKVTRAVGEAEEAVGGKDALNTLRHWAANGGIPNAKLVSWGEKLKADPSFYPDYMRLINQAHTAAVRADKAEPLITGQNNPNSATPGTPTNLKELAKLMYRVNNGDPEALAVLNKISDLEQLGA